MMTSAWKKVIPLIVAAGFFASASTADRDKTAPALEVRVLNASSAPVTDQPVVVPVNRLPLKYRQARLAVLRPDGGDAPCQIDDLNSDGAPDELIFLVSVGADRGARYRVILPTPKVNQNAPSDTADRKQKLVFANEALRCRFSNESPAVIFSMRRRVSRGWNPCGFAFWEATTSRRWSGLTGRSGT